MELEKRGWRRFNDKAIAAFTKVGRKPGVIE
jgi:hypothetical protein